MRARHIEHCLETKGQASESYKARTKSTSRPYRCFTLLLPHQADVSMIEKILESQPREAMVPCEWELVHCQCRLHQTRFLIILLSR